MYKVTVNEDKIFSIKTISQAVLANDVQFAPEITRIDDSAFLVILDKKPYYVSVLKVSEDRRNFHFQVNNRPLSVRINHQSELAPAVSGQVGSKRFTEYIKSPMPGLIVDVLVRDGEAVIDGQPLLILKAMKMENILRAPHDGTIRRVLVEKGQKIDKESTLIQF